MALCTTVGPFGLLSGSFAKRSASAGVVASPTAGRNVLREYLIPNNPSTQAQQAARSRFVSCVNGFSTLSQSEIDPWRDFADAIERSGRLGLPYKPSAANMYIGVNCLRLLDGQTISDTPPALELLPAIDPETIALAYTGPSTFKINWTASLPAQSLVVVRMSRALPTASRLARRNECILATLPAASVVLDSLATLTISAAKVGAALSTYHGVMIQSVSAGYVPGAVAFVPQLQFPAS